MKNEMAEKILFLAIVAERKRKDSILLALTNAGAHITNTMYGKGTANASYLKNTLGLVPEEHKVVITCVSTRVKIAAVLKLLVEEFHFNRPNTGIAFTVPVEKVSY